MQPMLHLLHDGRRVRIRPIEPGDKARLAAGMAKLSQETIHRRFLAAKPSLSAPELRYLTEVDGVRHIALVAVLEEDPEQLVGVARCVRLQPGAETAEFAVVVGDPVQGQGVGSALGRALAQAAWEVGIRRFTATLLADNGAVMRLMAGFAARIERGAPVGGVREVVAVLPPGGREPAAQGLAA
jgi:RimJ/RimL family protein N-acetyltransferase